MEDSEPGAGGQLQNKKQNTDQQELSFCELESQTE